MITIKNFEEFLDIVNSENNRYFVVQHDEFGGDHCMICHSILIRDTQDNSYYGLFYESHSEEGADPWNQLSFPMTLKPITPRVISAYKWSASEIVT